jgi:hypothetical protein
MQQEYARSHGEGRKPPHDQYQESQIRERETNSIGGAVCDEA